MIFQVELVIHKAGEGLAWGVVLYNYYLVNFQFLTIIGFYEH